MDDLARSSLPPQEALATGKPTILEFYADWCEVCQEMAPAMLEAKQQFSEDIDFVLLNVDNQQWIDLLKKYKVNGIPQLNLFDEDGSVYASSIGKRNQNEIFNLMQSVLQKKSIEDTYQVGKISSLEQKSSGTKENALAGKEYIKIASEEFSETLNIIAAGSITNTNLKEIHSELNMKEYHGKEIVGDLILKEYNKRR